MSAVAWHEDVDRALMRELKESVRIYKKSKAVPLPDKNIIVRKPEEDYKIEVYPSVSLYNITDNPDLRRYNRYEKRGFARTGYARASFQRPLSPFELIYQLDFWAKFKTDMNAMTESWLTTGHFDQFNLYLSDEDKEDGDVNVSCNVMQDGNVVHSDLLLEKERLFHDIISYRIWVEIEDKTVYTIPIAERVDLNVHAKCKKCNKEE